MPLSCAAYGCSNHNQKEDKTGFYRFPNNNAVLRQKWINACKHVKKRWNTMESAREKCLHKWKAFYIW